MSPPLQVNQMCLQQKASDLHLRFLTTPHPLIYLPNHHQRRSQYNQAYLQSLLPLLLCLDSHPNRDQVHQIFLQNCLQRSHHRHHRHPRNLLLPFNQPCLQSRAHPCSLINLSNHQFLLTDSLPNHQLRIHPGMILNCRNLPSNLQ